MQPVEPDEGVDGLGDEREELTHAGVEQERLLGADQELVEREPGRWRDVGDERRQSVHVGGDLGDGRVHAATICTIARAHIGGSPVLSSGGSPDPLTSRRAWRRWRLRRVAHAELGQDASDMVLDRLRGQEQSLCDLGIAVATLETGQDLQLACGETPDRVGDRRRPGRRRPERSQRCRRPVDQRRTCARTAAAWAARADAIAAARSPNAHLTVDDVEAKSHRQQRGWCVGEPVEGAVERNQRTSRVTGGDLDPASDGIRQRGDTRRRRRRLPSMRAGRRLGGRPARPHVPTRRRRAAPAARRRASHR